MMEDKKALELYFHIPFCVRKCLYCDFLSGPYGDADREAYMKALFVEARERAADCSDYRITSIFIGGGTPSVAEESAISKLMDIIRECYYTDSDMEVTIEVNPGTVNADKLRAYRAAGINRLSIGLQSANNRELQTLGRIHTYDDFLETYSMAREEGFTNINVDIMSALPGQTMESYTDTLEKVLELSPEHISAYSLIVEEGTPFFGQYGQGSDLLPDEDTEREMYKQTAEILASKGYKRYEISNYATEGMECRHNTGYWNRTAYLGLGIGAASMMNNCRFTNGPDFRAYISNPLGQRGEVTELSLQEQMEETMYLGLRMTAGVPAEDFRRIFGRDMEQVYGEVIRWGIGEGLLQYKEISGMVGRSLALTDRGLDVSNYVMARFLF